MRKRLRLGRPPAAMPCVALPCNPLSRSAREPAWVLALGSVLRCWPQWALTARLYHLPLPLALRWARRASESRALPASSDRWTVWSFASAAGALSVVVFHLLSQAPLDPNSALSPVEETQVSGSECNQAGNRGQQPEPDDNSLIEVAYRHEREAVRE